jgi:hypothetical protein
MILISPIHETGSNWVLMYILHFLINNFVPVKSNWIVTILPELIGYIVLIGTTILPEFVEHPAFLLSCEFSSIIFTNSLQVNPLKSRRIDDSDSISVSAIICK